MLWINFRKGFPEHTPWCRGLALETPRQSSRRQTRRSARGEAPALTQIRVKHCGIVSPLHPSNSYQTRGLPGPILDQTVLGQGRKTIFSVTSLRTLGKGGEERRHHWHQVPARSYHSEILWAVGRVSSDRTHREKRCL